MYHLTSDYIPSLYYKVNSFKFWLAILHVTVLKKKQFIELKLVKNLNYPVNIIYSYLPATDSTSYILYTVFENRNATVW